MPGSDIPTRPYLRNSARRGRRATRRTRRRGTVSAERIRGAGRYGRCGSVQDGVGCGGAASLRLSEFAAPGAPRLGAHESIPGGIARAAEPDLGDLRPRADNLSTGWRG